MGKNKTPAKRQSTGGAQKQQQQSASKQQQSAQKKKEQQLMKQMEEEEEDEEEEDDEDVMEQMKAAALMKGDPEDSEDDDEDAGHKSFTTARAKLGDDDEDEDDEDDEDYEEGDANVFNVMEHLANSNQICIPVPAGESVHVLGIQTEDRSYPIHFTSACLGPDAEEKDRATVVASFLNDDEELSEDEEDDEEDEEEKMARMAEEDEEEGLEELVLGTLCMFHCENITLDVLADGNFVLSNTSQATDVYLTGRVVTGGDDEDDEDYDFEDDEEDEDDEDGEEGVFESDGPKRVAIQNGDADSDDDAPPAKKMRQTGAPKEIEVKKGGSVSEDDVVKVVLNELKQKKQIKNTDLGALISEKLGKSFKKMGFAEKSLTKFLSEKAKGKLVVTDQYVKQA